MKETHLATQITKYMRNEDILLDREDKDPIDYEKWWLDAFVEGRGGTYFTATQVVQELRVSLRWAIDLLNSHPLVEKYTLKNKSIRYKSLATPLEPSIEGLMAIAQERTVFDLGYQANADYWELVASRTEAVNQRRRGKLPKFSNVSPL